MAKGRNREREGWPSLRRQAALGVPAPVWEGVRLTAKREPALALSVTLGGMISPRGNHPAERPKGHRRVGGICAPSWA